MFSIMVLAHRDELTARTCAKFQRVVPGAATSAIGATAMSWGGQVAFAMVPTLARASNLTDMPRLDMLVVDEAHPCLRRQLPPHHRPGARGHKLWTPRTVYPAGKDTDMLIRPAVDTDRPMIWEIIGPTIRAGETYALDSDLSQEDALAYWLGVDRDTFVAEEDGRLVGTYYIRANQAGGGRHVCNCGYMTAELAAGRGVARKMHAHSLDHARKKGFRAMQFNFVISTNTRAIALWTSLGFDVIGRLPGAFLHPRHGYVDALIFHRRL